MARMESATVYKWILDYYCYTAWDDFVNNYSLSACLLDSIQGLLGSETEVIGDDSSSDRLDKKLFLTVLSRIADGEDTDMKYEGSDLSPLEDLLPHFFNLVNLQRDEDLIEDGKNIYKIIKLEAVLAHLRKKQYGLALKCYTNLFSDEEKMKDKNVKKLRSYIKEKKTVENVKYTDFIDSMIAYLQKIVDDFETPLLIMAARNLLKSHKQCNERVTRIDAEQCLQENTRDNNCNNPSDIRQDKHTLRRLWRQNVKNMFGSPSPEKTSTPMISSPILPKASTIPHKSKTSSVTSKTLASPQPGTSTASTPGQSPLQLNTSAKSCPEQVQLFKSPSSSLLKSGLRINKSGMSDKQATPEPQYKKNQGRLNRHEPCPSVCSFRDDISEMSSGHRKRKWTEDEMKEFFNAVKSFGVGNWAEMRDYLNTSRTSVMLKDKWRTMVKNGDAARLESSSAKKKKTV